ncbi:hypothetical protein LTR94_031364, partial [Friedmanniomyces endolithicus]
MLRPLVDFVNRRPIAERHTEALYRVHVVCAPERVSMARDLLYEELEVHDYPVREIEVMTESDAAVELAAEAALPAQSALARLAADAGLDRAALGALLHLQGRGVLRHHRAQGLGHARGFRVLEIDHVDIALARALLIQAGDQALGQVGARLGQRQL